MAKSHAELNQMLDTLDESVPGLVQSKPNASDFWSTFTHLAEAVQQNAAADDRGWICDRLDAI